MSWCCVRGRQTTVENRLITPGQRPSIINHLLQVFSTRYNMTTTGTYSFSLELDKWTPDSKTRPRRRRSYHTQSFPVSCFGCSDSCSVLSPSFLPVSTWPRTAVHALNFIDSTSYKLCFPVIALTVWNSLPQTILIGDPLSVFKSRFKTFSINQAFTEHWSYMPPAPLTVRRYRNSIIIYYCCYYYAFGHLCVSCHEPWSWPWPSYVPYILLPPVAHRSSRNNLDTVRCSINHVDLFSDSVYLVVRFVFTGSILSSSNRRWFYVCNFITSLLWLTESTAFSAF